MATKRVNLSIESKKLALIRIWQILKEYSDQNHLLTQEMIARHLDEGYGTELERKAISRNIELLNLAGIKVETTKKGCYLVDNTFKDSELHLLIDSVLSSKHISVKQSKDLIDRLCKQSNKYFKSNVKHIHSVNEWNKTDNQMLFDNIELIHEAIDKRLQIQYDYNKYGTDKKLHKSSDQIISPYQMLIHNQRYYLMGYSEYWGNLVYHRLDHITNMSITKDKLKPLSKISGYENGINYRELSSAMPYMFTDKPERIIFSADISIIDQIIDWFGSDITIMKDKDEKKIQVSLKASPNAMHYWALQYVNYVEILSPDALRNRVKESLEKGLDRYS